MDSKLTSTDTTFTPTIQSYFGVNPYFSGTIIYTPDVSNWHFWDNNLNRIIFFISWWNSTIATMTTDSDSKCISYDIVRRDSSSAVQCIYLVVEFWNGPDGPIRFGPDRDRGLSRTVIVDWVGPWTVPCSITVRSNSGSVLPSSENGLCRPVSCGPITEPDRGPCGTVNRTVPSWTAPRIFGIFIIFLVLFDF
jgi:hypothetical protein